jgi:hypothetical protein
VRSESTHAPLEAARLLNNLQILLVDDDTREFEAFLLE